MWTTLAQCTFEVVPGQIFQCLIKEDYWDRNLQHHDPLGPAQGGHLEDQLRDRGRCWKMINEQMHRAVRFLPQSTYRQRLNVEDQEVEGEGQDDRSQQPNVDPRRHPDQGLVLRQTGGEMF